MNLVIHNDVELSRAVCELVQHAVWNDPTSEEIASGAYYHYAPRFATSADAVLPLLNKTFCVWSYHTDEAPGRLCADTTRRYEKLHQAFGPFPRAACVVLLQAAGHEVTFA